MDLDFSKCKTKEDVEKVFEENKPTMDMAKDFVKKMEEASKMPGIQAFIKEARNKNLGGKMKIFMILAILLISFVILFEFYLILDYHKHIKIHEETFNLISICLANDDVTKDLWGAFTNEDGNIVCVYGIGNGVVKREIIDKEELSLKGGKK